VVDTLKLHCYHGEVTTTRELIAYGDKLLVLSQLKEEAYGVKANDNNMRFVNYTMGNDRFRVMATTVKGFQVTLQNQDVSLSFKSVKRDSFEYPEGYDFDAVVDTKRQPVIRIEFRASYLARVGHEEAIRYVLSLIRREFIQSYQVKVSEIHLATDVQGYRFHELDRQRFRTRKKTSTGHNGQELEHFYYFGKRFTGFSFGTGDNMIRIYNKSIEIDQNPDKAFIKKLVWEQNKKYNQNEEVWRIECQYRRAKLKTMVDEEYGLLDGFENVLKAIPSLWAKSLDSFTMIDLDEQKAISHFMGFERNANGDKVPLELNTVRMRIKRASIHPLWDQMRSWCFSFGRKIATFLAPKTGAFQWVSNSIKSFLSTLLKNAGDLSPALIEDAFIRAEEECIADKGLTLVDNAVNNTFDYLGALVKYETKVGEVVAHHDSFATLQKNLMMYVREASLGLFDPYELRDNRDGFFDSRAKILKKSMGRYLYAG